MLSRRDLLIRGFLLVTAAKIKASLPAAPSLKQKFKIGACDWSLGMNSDIRAFAIARTIGLDGLMVDVGSPSNNLHLRNKEVQQQYLQESERTGVAISSLALGALNNFPYKSDPQTEEWVWDSIDVAKNLGVPVILLAFFHKNDLRNDESGIKEVIRKLKAVSKKAEQSGIILGIESYLNGADHLRIIEAVGSKNVKVYMDFRNTADAKWSVLNEVKTIGAQNICELHMKENGQLLGQGDLPWNSICKLLEEMNYTGDGWMQIESSNPETSDVITNYKHNLQFLQQLFNKKSA
ncbi:MAG TPA: sugar phosphate isomerase/epimerase family protein [Flavitalea sp.]|nr:sugar phosphate isomerase/epimerase family protein [Flavitalea sp.]